MAALTALGLSVTAPNAATSDAGFPGVMSIKNICLELSGDCSRDLAAQFEQVVIDDRPAAKACPEVPVLIPFAAVLGTLFAGHYQPKPEIRRNGS